MSSLENTESVQNILSEETLIQVTSIEKPIIIKKSLLQILIELFSGCTSKSSVSNVINPAIEIVDELSNVTIEVIIEKTNESPEEKNNNINKE
jgi:hypothetical protein